MPTSMVAPPFKICTSIFNLEDLGCGFPLYFEFKKFIFLTFLIMICVFSFAALVFNSNEDRADQWNKGAEPSSILKTTIGNYGAIPISYDNNELIIEAYLNFGVIVLILILTNFLRKRQLTLEKKIDEQNLTPPDFTVYVMDLPQDKTEQETIEWFKEYDTELEIKKINYCYDIKEIVTKLRELDKWQKMKNYVEFYRQKKCKELNMTEDQARENGHDIDPPRVDYDYICIKETFPTYETIIEKVNAKVAEVESLKRDMDVKTDKDLYVGKAFLTLEKQSQAARLVKKFEMHTLIRAVFFIYYKIFRCKNSKLEKRYWEGERIIIERAAEPGDVYWENLSVRSFERFIKSLLTYSATALLLVLVFGIYFSLNLLKTYLEDKSQENIDEDDGGESNKFIWLVRLVSFGTSIVAIIVNAVLNWIIRLLSSFEKHMTYTRYHLSVATKLMMATFINIALLPLINNLDKEDWFDNGGLANTIFFNVISVSFVSPILSFFNFGYLLKRFSMWRELRKGIESKLTQRQANDLFEGPALDIATTYAQSGLIFLLVSFYTPIVPILPFIAIVGVFFQYWIEKYLLLRRYSIPEAMGSTMAKFYASLIPYGMLLYAISNYIFLNDLSDGENTHGQWSLWFMIAYIVLPVRIILNLFTDNIDRSDEYAYSKEQFNFFQDYDRSNPLTSSKAKTE